MSREASSSAAARPIAAPSRVAAIDREAAGRGDHSSTPGTLVLWLPVVAWAALISVLSTSYFSAAATAGLIEPLLRWLMPHARWETIAVAHELIRKAAHFTEFAIFFWLLARGPLRERIGMALVICAIYALADESHQMIVPGRGPSLFDAGLDFSGALFSNFLRTALSGIMDLD